MSSSWLVDLPKSPKIKTNGNSNKSDVNKARWTVEEVMYYYGEWIESEELAIFIMKYIEIKINRFGSLAFTHRMNMVRDYLIYKQGIKNVPFVPNYRRIKDD